MNPRTQPGGVLMQTEDSVVAQGYPTTGQQPAYVLLQVTRNKTFYTDTKINESKFEQTKFQAVYQMFFSCLVCLSGSKLIIIPCSAVFTMGIQFWSKVIHDCIDCERMYFRKVSKGEKRIECCHLDA